MPLLQITDDSGFLGLFDPDAYRSFVKEDWEFEQLVLHFVAEMKRRALLLWGTGCEGFWRVKLSRRQSGVKGYREKSGTIACSRGRLCLINYESLTMGAQFKDISLPERHHANLVQSFAPGQYDCRVVQLFDPEQVGGNRAGDADFLIEMKRSTKSLSAWGKIPWCTSYT